MLRMMGQNEYGLYSLVASVVAYLTVLDLGFGNAIIRYTAKFRAEGKKREQYEMFGMFLRLYTLIGVVAFLCGMLLYYNIENLFGKTMTADDLSKVRVMLLLMSFNLAVTFPLSIFGSIITAYEDFVFQKTVNIIRIILNPVVMVIMLYIGYRAIGMVVVTTIFNVLTLLINWWYCKHKIHIKIYRGKFKWDFFREISVYSFWIFLNAIMDRIYWSTGQFVLGVYQGAAVVAIYAVAIQLQTIYMSFSTAISSVFLPKVTGMVTKGQSEKSISDLFIRTGRNQYIVMAYILTGFIVFGKEFIVFWAGADYQSAYYIPLLFFIPLTVPLIQNLGITILQARNQMKFRSLLYLVIAVMSLSLSIPLSKYYGGIGCAVGTSLALLLGQVIVMNIYYHKKIHIDILRFWKEVGKMSLVPLLLGVISYCAVQYAPIQKSLGLFILSVFLFSLIYIVLFWHISMNNYERDLIKQSVKKILSILIK